jgi:hypothetical protein
MQFNCNEKRRNVRVNVVCNVEARTEFVIGASRSRVTRRVIIIRSAHKTFTYEANKVETPSCRRRRHGDMSCSPPEISRSLNMGTQRQDERNKELDVTYTIRAMPSYEFIDIDIGDIGITNTGIYQRDLVDAAFDCG